MPLEMDCTECGGQGCLYCAAGRITITDCPLLLLDQDVLLLADAAELYRKGLPPVAGGSLDQAQCFVSACRFLWSEEAFWKNKLKLIE